MGASESIILYQKDIKRSYYLISSSFLASTRSKVKFQSIAKDDMGEIFENKIWEVIVDYEIEPINTGLPDGSRFNFTVTDYQLKLLEDKTIIFFRKCLRYKRIQTYSY